VKNIRKAVLKAPLNQRGISRSVLSFPLVLLVNHREVDAKRCAAAAFVQLEQACGSIERCKNSYSNIVHATYVIFQFQMVVHQVIEGGIVA